MKTSAIPEVSVIVPFYNAERYIHECIRGLLSQSYPQDACEILMIDNNSTDASVEIVKQHSRIRLLAEKKQGAYAARNHGIAAAQGTILAFTDPDCVPGTHWLRNLVAAMLPAEVRIVLGNCQMARHSLGLSLLAAYEQQKIRFVCNSRTKELYYGYTNNMAVRKEVFAQLGLFPERARGADSMFVRQVVDEFSSGAVRYEANAHVRHLEMDGLWKYYQKQFIYGRSNRLWGEMIATRPLTFGERLQVFRRTIQSEGYSLPRAALLLFLLGLGVVSYTGGHWAAVWSLWYRTATKLAGRDSLLLPRND